MSSMNIDNHVRQLAQQASQEAIGVRIGTVTGYDPASYKAKVALQPTGEETSWLPIGSLWVGNEWGLFCPPTVGDLVEVHFPDHDINAGTIACRFFNSVDRPVSVPSGEFLLKHASGTLLQFFNDGQVKLVSASTLTSTAPEWNHTGPVNIYGDVFIKGNQDVDGDVGVTGTETVQGKISGFGGMGIKGGSGGAAVTVEGTVGVTSGDVVADGIQLKGHVHGGVDPGGGTTAGPQ